MKTLSTPLFLLIFSLGATISKAQTADDIASKYVQAIGGKDVITSIKTIYAEGTLDVMGNQAATTTYIVNGKDFKFQFDINGQQIVQVVTDKGGWMINPMMGAATATAMPDELVKSSRQNLDLGGPLFNYAAKGSKLELLGKDTTGGGNAYKLRLTTRDSLVMNMFIDANTGYLMKMVTRAPGPDGGDITVNFSDFKKLDDGYVMAYTQQIETPQYTASMTSKTVEVNKTIDPTIFDMPK